MQKLTVPIRHVSKCSGIQPGHLAALLGAMGQVEELQVEGHNRGLNISSSIQAVAAWSAPVDFLQMLVGFQDSPESMESLLIGGYVVAIITVFSSDTFQGFRSVLLGVFPVDSTDGGLSAIYSCQNVRGRLGILIGGKFDLVIVI